MNTHWPLVTTATIEIGGETKHPASEESVQLPTLLPPPHNYTLGSSA